MCISRRILMKSSEYNIQHFESFDIPRDIIKKCRFYILHLPSNFFFAKWIFRSKLRMKWLISSLFLVTDIVKYNDCCIRFYISFCSTNVVMNYTEVETKVREATNDDAWGPHGQIMQEIARYTFTYEHFPEVMGMLWKRMLHDNKKNWRRTYKVKMSD